MATEITHDGITLVPSREAARRFGITNDYIGRLCRSEKIIGKLIAGSWYVNEESLRAFLLKTNREKYERREALREARALEYRAAQSKNSAAGEAPAKKTVLAPVASAPKRKRVPLRIHPAPRRIPKTLTTFAQRGAVVMFLLMVFVGGIRFSDASVFATARKFLPAAAAIAGLNDGVVQGAGGVLASLFSAAKDDSYWIWYESQPSVADTQAPPGRTQTAAAAEADSSSDSKPSIIERVVQAVAPTYIVNGISEDILNARLAALENRLIAQIAAIPISTNVAPIYQVVGGISTVASSFDSISITDSTITDSTITGGSLSGVALDASDLTGVVAVANGGTGTSTYAAGDLLYADAADSLGRLPIGSDGKVLKVVGGQLVWSTDLSGSGAGGGAFATTSDNLAVHPADIAQVVLIGTDATSTEGNILEVLGNSLLRGTVTAYDAVVAPSFTATSSATSTFPRLNISGSLGLGSDYLTDLTGDGLTVSGGALSLDTSGDWTGTFDGHEGSFYLANSFSTTSADYYISQANLSGFSTTSADYWKTVNNFFSTTSTDYWLTTKDTDDLAQGATNKYYSSLLFAGDLAGTTTDALAEGSTNLYFTSARATSSFVGNLAATSSISSITSLPNLSITESQISDLDHYTDADAQTFLDTLAKGYFFSTTSASYYISQANLSGFSTTSADYWKSVSNFFSTTSAIYFLGENQSLAFSTTSADYLLSTKGYSTFGYLFPGNATSTNISFSGGITGNLTGDVTGDLTGNADTATKLATARTINGVSFDGSADITITAASSTLLSDNNTFSGRLNADSFFITPSIVGSTQAGFVADGGNRTTVDVGINKQQFGSRTTALAGSIMRFDARAGHPLFSVIYDAPGHTGGGNDENFPLQMTTSGNLLVGNGWNGDNNTGTGNGQDLQVKGSGYVGGNLGLGTTSPFTKLGVAGGAYIGGSLTATGTIQFSNLTGGALASDASGNLYTFSTSTWSFASSTLLADSNTFSGTNTFSSTITGSVSGNAGTVTNGVYTTTFGGLFDARLAATTSLPNITTLANLSITESQISDLDHYTDADAQSFLDTLAKGYFFSTTSADYWKTVNNFFSTTSTDYWLTTKDTDDLAQGATNKYYSSLLFAGDLAGTTTDALAEGSNLYFTDARATANFVSNLAATTSVASITALPNLSLPLSQTTGTLAANRGGTGQSTYAVGDILYADTTSSLTRLPVGSAGQVLKVSGGLPTWGADIASGGSGGATAFSTTSDSLAIYPTDTSDVLIIGNSATSTLNSIFEVAGKSYFSQNVGIGTTSPGSILAIGGVGNFASGGSTLYSSLTLGSLTATGTIQFSNLTGGALASDASGNLYTFSTSTWSFASSTLLADSNTFSGTNTFSNTITGDISGNAGTVTNGVYTTTFNSLFDPRFVTDLAATSSISSITTLPNLSLPSSQVTGLFSYLFPSDATSTKLTFSGGLLSLASTTIGNGTAAGGLTIAGNATTTGNVYIAGNVGIGTQTPTDRLHIAGNLKISGYDGTSGIISFGDAGAAATSSGAGLYIGRGLDGQFDASALSFGGFGGFAFHTNDTPGSTSTPQVVITGTGNVGLGTTSPFTKLDVAGGAYIGGNLTATGTVAFTGLSSGFVGSNNGTLYTFASSSLTAASSTLLSDDNTFSGTNIFSNTITGDISGNAGTVTNGVYTTTFNSLFDPRFVTDLAATSSISSITSLPNLSITESQISDLDHYTDADTQTYLASVDKGFFFSTTSADHWKTVNNFFSTTSASYFLAQNQGNAFSTTSADFWKTATDFFSTTSASYFVHSSTTIPKTYTANTFSALQSFANASSTLFSSTYASSTNLFAGSATTSLLTLTNLSSTLLKVNASGQVAAAVAGTDYANFGYLFPSNATSTNITFSGGITGNLTGDVTGDLTGNADTATKLATARTINGVSFDGSANITITAASSTLLANNNTFSGTNVFSNTITGDISGNAGTVTNGVYTTTFGGLFAGQLAGTTTDALSEGTDNLYWTTARGIASFVSNLAATTSVASITALPNLSLPYSQITGAPAAAGYPFALSGNATSTLTQFNGGLTAFASSTIGNGTQAGGLTVSGGATTTGIAYFAGNVGIGETSPAAKLAVVQSGGTASDLLHLRDATDGEDLVVRYNGTNGFEFRSELSGTGSDMLTLLTNGNVGIGTTSPWTKLSVAGNGYFDGSLTSGNLTATGTVAFTGLAGAGLLYADANGTVSSVATSTWSFASSTLLADNNTFSGSTIFSAPLSLTGTTGTTTIASGQGFAVGSSQFVVQQGSGNVGIGTTSPNVKLTVLKGGVAETWTPYISTVANFEGSAGGHSVVSIIAPSTGHAELWFGDEDTQSAGRVRYNNDLNTLQLVAGAGILTLDTAGNVGIGTTSPWTKLSVAGNGYFDGSLTSGNLTATGTVAFTGLAGAGLLYADANGTLSSVATSTWSFASSTLLSDDNTFSGTNAFGILSATYASTTQISSTGNAYFATSGGNVGIGTTSLTHKLTLGLSDGDGISLGDRNATGTFYIGRTAAGLFGTNSGQIAFPTDGANGNSIIYRTNSGDHIFETTNGYERMRITNAGNVGIGTTSPFTKLGVAGGAYIGGNLTATGTVAFTGLTSGLLYADANGTVSSVATSTWSFASSTLLADSNTFSGQNIFSGATTTFSNGIAAASNAFNILSNGNVGIGTTSPSVALTVSGSTFTAGAGGDFLLTGSSAIGAGITLASTDTGGRRYSIFTTGSGSSAGAGKLSFYDNASANHRLVIDSSGHIGIGTTTPGAMLSAEIVGAGDIFKTTRFGTSAYFTINHANAFTNFDSNDDYTFSFGGTERVRFDSTGNVGIGTTSPFTKLGIAGNAYIGGNLTATGTIQFSNLTGGALASDASGNLYTFSTSTWSFASSTLLADSNTFSGTNTFSSTITGSVSGNAGTVTNGVYTTTFNSLFDPRFVTDLAATSSISSITALPNLSLPSSQVTGLFSYLFPSDATSTKLTFSGGLLSLASTTIGNGTAAGGLTIAGNATTTGSLIVQGTGTSTFANGIQLSAGCFKDAGGNCIVNTDTSTLVDGAGNGSASRVAYWSDSNTLTSSANLQFDGTTLTANDILLQKASPVFSINDTGSTGTDFRIDVASGGATFKADVGSNLSNEYFAWSTNNTEKARLLENGNFGLGTTSPFSKLSVAGDAFIGGNLTATGTVAFTGLSSGFVGSNNGTLYTFASSSLTAASSTLLADNNLFSGSNTFSSLLKMTNGLLATASSTIGNGTQAGGLTVSGGATTTGNAYFAGNVGIGTSTPSRKLEIYDAIAAVLRISRGADSAYASVDYLPSGAISSSNPIWGSGLFPNSSNYSIWNADGSADNRLFDVTAAGNIGLGTTSPFTKLSVAGGTYIGGNLTATGTVAFTGLSSGFVGSNNGTLYTFASSSLTAASSTLLADNNLFSGSNTFSSLLKMTNGLLATASSTIGNGTQTGGLTVSGGATTTGNAYVAGQTLLSDGSLASPSLAYASEPDMGWYRAGTHAATFGVGGFSKLTINGALNLLSGANSDAFGIALGGSGLNQAVFLPDMSDTNTGLGDGGGDDTLALITNGATRLFVGTTGNVGIGTTSPFSKLSIHANNGDTNTTLFSIASSTASGTTTLFSISNTGTTTAANGFNITAGCFAVNGSCLSSGSSGASDFTFANNFGALNAATSSVLWAQSGINASSTSRFFDVSLFGAIDFATTSTSTLATLGGLPFITASTSISQTTFGFGAGAKLASAGVGIFEAGNMNTAFGSLALSSATSSTANTAFGAGALAADVNNGFLSGLNTAVGGSALASNTYGDANSGVGYGALTSNTTGSNNTALGYTSLYSVTTGLGNTAVGSGVGFGSLTSGSYNTLLGFFAGSGLATGSYNIGIGYGARFPSTSADGQLSIGNAIFGTGLGSSGALYPTTTAIGVGTSSPFAEFAIHANNGGVFPTLFAIGSSTASGTTTLFSISNTGTTTAANGFNITAGCFSIAGTCIGGGGGSSFGYLFPSDATSTKLTFSGGLLSLASTTIGNGTAAGGLTIAGNATTTGNVYIAGNVGIGTQTPTDRLHIAGNLKISGYDGTSGIISFGDAGAAATSSGAGLYIGRGLDGQFDASALSFGGFGGFAFHTNDTPGSTSTPQVVITGTGNVGLGTTSPNSIFSVSSTLPTVATFENSAAGGADWSLYVGDSGSGIPAGSFGIGPGPGASGSSKLVISSAGNVGVGSTTPGSLLSVGTTNGINFSTATSTFNSTGGINLAAGCFSIAGTCLGGGGGASLTGSTGQVAYFSGTDTAAGTSTLFIAPSGNVGIGTNSPLASFSVGPLQTAFTNSASSTIISGGSLPATLDGFHWMTEFRSNASGNQDRLLIGQHRTTAGTDWTTAAWRIQPAVDNSFTGMSSNRGYLEFAFGTAGSYKGIGLSGAGNMTPDLIVSSTGNIGIGTSTPSAKLDVNGSITGTSLYAGGGIASSGYQNIQLSYDTTNDVGKIQAAHWGTGFTSLALNPSGGSVGIGTTTPWGLLSVNPNGTSGPAFVIGSSTATLFSVNRSGAGSIFNFGLNSTSTVPNNTPYAWTIATSTTAKPLFAINSTSGSEGVSFGVSGSDVVIGDVGAGSNLVFEENATIKGQGSGRTLTIGANSDQINFGVNLGIGTTTAFSELTVATGDIGAFNGAICADNGGTAKCYGSLTAGTVYGDTSSFTASDVAENYSVVDSSIGAGDIVSIALEMSDDEKAKREEDRETLAKMYPDGVPASFRDSLSSALERATTTERVLGVISTQPGVLLGDVTGLALKTALRPVALSGRVPVKVNLEGGEIRVGDSITLSSQAGVGKKALPTDVSIGVALESYTASSTSGTVLTFVDPGGNPLAAAVAQMDLQFQALASTTFATSTVEEDGTVTFLPGGAFLQDFFNNVFARITRWLADAKNGIGDFFAGTVHTKEICVGESGNETCITKAQLDSLLAGAAQAAAPSTPSSPEEEGETEEVTEDVSPSEDVSDDTASTTPAIEEDTETPADTESATPPSDEAPPEDAAIESAPETAGAEEEEAAPPAAETPAPEAPAETPAPETTAAAGDAASTTP